MENLTYNFSKLQIEKPNLEYAKVLSNIYSGEDSIQTLFHLYFYQSLIAKDQFDEYYLVLEKVLLVEYNHFKLSIMTREDIVKEVNNLLAEEFEVDLELFTPDANVRDTLSLDSLSLVDLVAIIQQTYKIKIPVADLKSINTFNDLYNYIESHLS